MAGQLVEDFFIAIHPEALDDFTGIRWCDLSNVLPIQLSSGEINNLHYLPVIIKSNEINSEITNYGLEWKNIATVSGETISVLSLPEDYEEYEEAVWSFQINSFILLQLSSPLPTIISSLIFNCISVQ